MGSVLHARTVNAMKIFSSSYVPSAGERVNKMDKALIFLKLMRKWRDNRYIGTYIGRWRVISTLENGRSRVN